MARNLTQFIELVRDLAGSFQPGSYSDRQITAAIRSALVEYQNYRPNVASYVVEGQANKTIVMPADFAAIKVLRVQKWATDSDDYVDVPFYAYRADEQWNIDTPGYNFASTDTLLVMYCGAHTIDDLDDASGTSVPEHDEHMLAVGAVGYLIRQNVGDPEA